MNNNHPNRSKWLKGNGGTDFLQFQYARITRTPFPLGGYMYVATTSEVEPVRLYSGDSYEKALDAIRRAKSE